jgi:predicted O-methyltransferase YrrM
VLQQVLDRWAAYNRGAYWTGNDCLSLRMPWFAPQATRALITRYADFLAGANVIELGCGGSTAFFSGLCKRVTSIETGREWAQRVRDLGLLNTVVLDWLDAPSVPAVIEKLLGPGDVPQFDVALIDGDPARYSRSVAASVLLPMMKPKAIFITDNYFLPDNLVKEFTVPYGLGSRRL